MAIVYYNGNLLPSDAVALHPDDRGFRYGDGAFETIAVHGGIPYLLEYHLERLLEGLRILRIPYDAAPLSAAIDAVIAANAMEKGILRLYITRGVGSQGYLPAEPPSDPTTLIQSLPPANIATTKVTLWLSQWQKISPRALPTACKIAQGVNATLARMEARDHGCQEALQLNAGGYICEASSANIFWLNQGVLYTPSLASGALAGTTRRRILQHYPKAVTEGEFLPETLQQAEAVVMTNATSGITAVQAIEPLGYHWNSEAAAQELNKWRQQDIADYLASRR